MTTSTISGSIKSGPTVPGLIDPRGPQFNAVLTSVVLGAILVLAPGPIGIALLGVQAALFAAGVVLGVQRTPVA
ncbi:MAG TPA: DUF4395 family protein, partial [Marmoricola sp.]|nr:DUF4395 family protein [Marmoricola sp.]